MLRMLVLPCLTNETVALKGPGLLGPGPFQFRDCDDAPRVMTADPAHTLSLRTDVDAYQKK